MRNFYMDPNSQGNSKYVKDNNRSGGRSYTNIPQYNLVISVIIIGLLLLSLSFLTRTPGSTDREDIESESNNTGQMMVVDSFEEFFI